MKFKAANPDDPELVRAAEVATVLVNEFYVFGDGDGSGPALESTGTGPVRDVRRHPIERMRRTFGDGSGTLVETYHAPYCEDLNCNGCGPVVLSISDLEVAVVEAAIKWRYQACSDNAVDDALWAAVEALLAAREKLPVPFDNLAEREGHG